jgi:hypothetical protein
MLDVLRRRVLAEQMLVHFLTHYLDRLTLKGRHPLRAGAHDRQVRQDPPAWTMSS